MLNKKTYITLLATTFVLSACNNDESKETTNNQSSFTTEFTSTLTLQKDSEPLVNISGRSSNENDEVNAYAVTHHFEKSKSTIIFSYNFDKNDVNKTLYVEYDPILKKILAISIGNKRVPTGQLEVGSMQYACSNVFYDACKNIQINYDDKTGLNEIVFNNTKLSTPHISFTNSIEPPPAKSLINLNGKLVGKLYKPPQAFENIRKTSEVNLSINNQPIVPVGIVYEPELKSVTFNTYTDNGINQGLKSDLFTTLINYNNGSNSSVYTQSYLALPMTGCLRSINTNIPVQNPLSIQIQETTEKVNLTFNQTKYLQIHEPLSNCIATNLNLHGTIKLNKPLTEYTITNYDNNNLTIPFNQPAVYFDVVNHNRQEFGNENIQIKIKDNKIEKINFKEITLGVDLSTGLLKRFESNFSCDKTQPCQGMNYDAANTKVTFTNTPLQYKDAQNPSSTRTFHINGIFDFAGR